jgi:hypothetical protein
MPSPVRKVVSESVLTQRSSLEKGWRELLKEYRKEAEDYAQQLYNLRRQNSDLHQETLQHSVPSPNRFKSTTVLDIGGKSSNNSKNGVYKGSEERSTKTAKSDETERVETKDFKESKDDKEFRDSKNDKEFRDSQDSKRKDSKPKDEIPLPKLNPTEVKTEKPITPTVSIHKNEVGTTYTVEISDDISTPSSINLSIENDEKIDEKATRKVQKGEAESNHANSNGILGTKEQISENTENTTVDEKETVNPTIELLSKSLNQFKSDGKDGKNVSYTKIKNLVLQSSTNVSPDGKERQSAKAVAPIPFQLPIAVPVSNPNPVPGADGLGRELDHIKEMIENNRRLDEIQSRMNQPAPIQIPQQSYDPTVPLILKHTQDQLLGTLKAEREINSENAKKMSEALKLLKTRLAQSEYRLSSQIQKESSERILGQLYNPKNLNFVDGKHKREYEDLLETAQKQNEDLRVNMEGIQLVQMVSNDEPVILKDFSETATIVSEVESLVFEAPDEPLFSIPMTSIFNETRSWKDYEETEVESVGESLKMEEIEEHFDFSKSITRQPIQNSQGTPESSILSLDEMPHEYVKVSSTLLKEVENQTETLLSELKKVRQENRELQNKLQEANNQKETAKYDHEVEMQGLKAENQTLQGEKNNYFDVLQDYTRQFTTVRPGVECLHPFDFIGPYDALKKEIESGKQTIESQKKEMQDKDAKIESLLEQIRGYISSNEKEKQTVNELKQKIKMNHEMHLEEKKALERRIQNMDSDHENINLKLQMALRANENLENTMRRIGESYSVIFSS